jgi:nucleotide-binding universal stress UspA family protein
MSARSIVVGVDGSPPSRYALAWALEEARRRKARLVVIHAWWAMPQLGETGIDVFAMPPDEAARLALERFVADAVGLPPATDVEMELRPVQGVTASEALVAASRGAELLVVGSRGLGGFSGLLLGSVSQQCAHHAECPLVIVRAADELANAA